MRVLVCGSRHFTDSRLLWDTLDDVRKERGIDLIISGHAKGADQLGELYADREGITCDLYPADWDKYGKTAGPIRNQQMLDEGKPDLVVAFLAKDSKGTANMIELATRAGIETKIIDI